MYKAGYLLRSFRRTPGSPLHAPTAAVAGCSGRLKKKSPPVVVQCRTQKLRSLLGFGQEVRSGGGIRKRRFCALPRLKPVYKIKCRNKKNQARDTVSEAEDPCLPTADILLTFSPMVYSQAAISTSWGLGGGGDASPSPPIPEPGAMVSMNSLAQCIRRWLASEFRQGGPTHETKKRTTHGWCQQSCPPPTRLLHPCANDKKPTAAR